jgi:hypothetical protein
MYILLNRKKLITSNNVKSHYRDYFSYINSQEFAEADIYAIYNKIMDIG